MAEFAFPPARCPETELRMDAPESRAPPVQLSLLCRCGKRIALKALGCCRSCYDRRHHSLRFFGGLRERVLERDRFRCRGCGKRSALVVHHRDRHNRENLLVTLCIRCHLRIHHSSGLRYWFSEMLARLWRELHPNAPMQFQLGFRNVTKKEGLKGSLEDVSLKGLSLLASPNARVPKLIGASHDEAHASNGLEKEMGWDETIHQGAGNSGAGNARGRGNASG
jgi:hypothetical protein